MKWKLAACAAVMLAGVQAPALSASVTIVNNSFEAPVAGAADGGVINNAVQGWTIGGTGGAGVWNINSFPYGFWNVPAPDGSQIAYLSNANINTFASISQTLAATLLPNAAYTLSGYVGHPIGHPALYSVTLLAGSNVLGTFATGSLQGAFAPFELTYNSTGSSFVGQALGIRLSSADSQTGFDNIQLNVAAIPEPSTYALMLAGLGFIGWVARRRRSA